MSDSATSSATVAVEDGGSSTATLLSSRLMIIAIAFFLVVVVFVALLDLYARFRWGPNSHRGRLRRSRLVFHEGRGDDTSAPRRGLAAEVLKKLPVRIYRTSDFIEAVECAVCLSELAEGDKVRMLPQCNHAFHVDCIDMWFHSHSTCPLCRNLVGTGDLPMPSQATRNEPSADTRGPAANERVLVIEIPSRTVDMFTSSASSPLSSCRRVHSMKSPVTASVTPSRLRSLSRMMSREKRVVVASCSGSPCSGGGGDLEMGATGSLTVSGGGSGGLKSSHKHPRGQ